MENDEEKINIQNIFENALKDPELFSTIDMEHLFDTIDNETGDYLVNKTMKSVTNDIFNAVNRLRITDEKKEEYCRKLTGYLHVDEIRELRKGKYIRWIREESHDKITSGAIIVNIKFLKDGTYIVCKNQNGRFMQVKFDTCMIFQKLTVEENVILMAYEYLDKKT